MVKWIVLAVVLSFGVAVAAIAYSGASSWGWKRGRVAAGHIPVGILGDSDSQSYQGRPPLGLSREAAGGRYHASTLQWPEVLARSHGKQLDLGEWAFWGVPRMLSMARVRDGLGLRWRAPRKEDYRHNLAWPSGCSALHEGPLRQAQRLVDIMDEDPAAWERGVVVIRSGVNDIGKQALDALAVDAEDAGVRGLVDTCLRHIGQAVAVIRERHPGVAIVVVGIFNNVHWVPYHDKFQSPQALANIDTGLDRFDGGLRAMARSQSRVVFFDDRAWFARHWGGRDAGGKPAYRTVRLGDGLNVTNTAGDAPTNAVLANQHAGLVWNTLWAQALVELLRTELKMPVEAMTNADVASFVGVKSNVPTRAAE